MNVLYILADRGHDLTVNSGCRIHVLKILEGLKRADHLPFLVMVNDKREIPGFCNYVTVPHRYLRFFVHRIVPYTGTLNSMRVLFKCLRLHATFKFDLIHERYGLYSYGGILLSKILRIPLVLEVNAALVDEKKLFTIPIRGAQKVAASVISRLCFSAADRIIAVSNVLKEILIGQWGCNPDKLYVLPNAADIEAFSRPFDSINAKRKLRLERSLTVGFVGTLHEWYGIEYLIDAFGMVLAEIPSARLFIIGDGQARQRLEEQAHRLGVKEKIVFTGNVKHEMIPEMLIAIDIAVAPFRKIPTGFYGSAIKVFEYMAAGKAIVASNIGQIGEVLEHERTGLLVEPGNSHSLAESILRLGKDKAFRAILGQNAMAQAKKKHSWDNYIDRLVEIYHEVLRPAERFGGNR